MADYSKYSADRKSKLCRGPCGQMLPVESFRNVKDYSSRGHFINSVCKVCQNAGVEQYRTATKAGIVAEIYRRKKSLCLIGGIKFDLTKDWIMNKLNAQSWRCALTGIPFNGFKAVGEKRRGYAWNSISLDRIKPDGGYTQSNSRFILNAVNLFKSDGPDHRMYKIARALLKKIK